MMEQKEQLQVDDRFFSPVFAYDAAMILWDTALHFEESDQKIIHIGNPIKSSRFSLASDIKTASNGKLDTEIKPVSYTYFTSNVARPKDTTWEDGTSLYITDYMYGLEKCYLEWETINNELRDTGK
jgi:dTDP-4-dehydrorhamnose reductase